MYLINTFVNHTRCVKNKNFMFFLEKSHEILHKVDSIDDHLNFILSQRKSLFQILRRKKPYRKL